MSYKKQGYTCYKKALYIVRSKHVLNYIKLQLVIFFLFIPAFAMCTCTFICMCHFQSLFPAKGGHQFREFPGKVDLGHICGKPGSVQN